MTCRRTTAISWKIFSHLTSKFLSKQTVIRRDPWPLPVSIQVSSTRGSCHSNLHLSRQTVEMRFCSNCLSSFYHKFFLRIRLEHPQCSSYSRNTDRNADSEQRMPGPPPQNMRAAVSSTEDNTQISCSKDTGNQRQERTLP
jgi:hypothetical protein